MALGTLHDEIPRSVSTAALAHTGHRRPFVISVSVDRGSACKQHSHVSSAGSSPD